MSEGGSKGGSGSANGSSAKGSSATGPGASANSSKATVNGSIDGMMTPELLFKMNKKVAQLTKVVYGLNTRGEELEGQLGQARVAEDVLREANADLTRRVNLYKIKLDSEPSSVGGEVHFYKMECENLKRRLEELSYGGLGMSGMREDLEQCRRREAGLQYELEQASHALSGIKAHHDFLLRESAAQVSMETEEVDRAWQARLAELETRHKLQLRHLTDELDAARSDSDMLKRRARSASEDNTYKDQLTALSFEREREGREWQLKLQLKEHELDEERIRHGKEKRERDTRIRQLTEEKRREVEQTEERLRSSNKAVESRLRDMQDRRDLLARQLEDKENEFESRLKTKVTEWKTQFDAVEDNLQSEIIKLKSENALIHSSQTIQTESKVQELRDELHKRASDYEVLSGNLKTRITAAESEAKSLAQEVKHHDKHLKDEREKNKQHQNRSSLQIEALERHLKEESDKFKVVQDKCDNLGGKLKNDLEKQVKTLQQEESTAKTNNLKLIAEVQAVKQEKDSLMTKLKDKEKEYKLLMEKELKAVEGKVKVRLEKSWVEKLKRTEESAAQDMERAREGQKRIEGDLKKEIQLLQKGEVENKRLNEEFKKKVRQLRQSEIELQQKLTQLGDSSRERERSLSRSNSVARTNSLLSGEQLTEDVAKDDRKELSTIEAKYQDQVDKLALALADKQQELANSKQEAEKLLKQSEERRRREKQELQDKLEKEKKELDVLNKKKTENEREKRELEEHNKRLEEEAAKAREADKSTKKDGREGSGEDGGDKDDEESEEECNKRKMEKIQNELLLLKQQNEEFEEMVREKHRKQIELEIEIGDIKREVTDREAKVDSVKVELCYSKNETELARAKTKRLEEEITEHKERVDTLERELDTSERELKRMEILQEKLRGTEAKRNELQTQLDEIEIERDEEIKIIQDALDEAAQEREELLTTFEKEIEKLNSLNAARETQMLEDFESKLKELEKQHKQEKDKLSETSIQHRGKRQPDEEEIRQRLDKMKSELNSEWEDKLRSERSRLKGDLDNLHAEEKHLAVESIRVQKEQDLQNLKKTFDAKAEEMEKELSNLKESLAAKDGFYRKELEDMRGVADRDVWELRRKLQKLDESSYDRQQYLEDKHREDIERLREDYADKMSGMEAQLSSFDVIGLTELRATLEKRHKEQMEHLGEQHSLSMVRLRDELESEKIQAAEDARVIVSKHHEYINTSLTEQLTEAITANTQYRDEIEAIRFALSRREEVIRSLEEDIAKLRSSSKGITPLTTGLPPSSVGAVGGASPPSSPFSHEGSQGSRSSQDRLSSDGVDEDGHRSSGLLGKVFGGGWFSGTKSKDTSPGHGGSAPTGSARRGSSGLYKQAW